jgi:hypothetical protein
MEAIMRKLILVLLVLVCAALGISAQDSLRKICAVDWFECRYVENAFTVIHKWYTPAQVFVREGTSEEGAPPPKAPDGWRDDGSPDWFKGGEVLNYRVRFYKVPDRPARGIYPMPMGKDFAGLTENYTGPVKLTPESTWVPWPFIANAADNFATADEIDVAGDLYGWLWLVDCDKSAPFDPFESTGVKDWLRHLGSSAVLDKWHYAPLDISYTGYMRWLPGLNHAYVSVSANMATGDVWVAIRVRDGDAPHDLRRGGEQFANPDNRMPRGFYVSAHYPGLL